MGAGTGSGWPCVDPEDHSALLEVLSLHVGEGVAAALCEGLLVIGPAAFLGDGPALPLAAWGAHLAQALCIERPYDFGAAAGLLLWSPCMPCPVGPLPRLRLALCLLGSADALLLDPGGDGQQAGPWPPLTEAALGGIGAQPDSDLELLVTLALRRAGASEAEVLLCHKDLTCAAGLYSALRRLWVDPELDDLKRVRLSPALVPLLLDDELGPRLRLALAADLSRPARLAEVQRILCEEGAWALIEAAMEAHLRAARAGVAGRRIAPWALSLCEAIEGALPALRVEVMVRRWGLGMVPSAAPWYEQVSQSLEVGRGALLDDLDWREADEHQRFGVGGLGGHLVASLFPRAFVASQLAPVDLRAARACEEIVATAPPMLRYYKDFEEIPPDADSLGVLLCLAARLPEPPRQVARWLEVMAWSAAPGGLVPTWLRSGPQGPTCAGEVSWGGDDCVGVRLSLVYGLLCFDARAEVIQVNLLDVLNAVSAAELRVQRCFHYEPWFVFGLLLKVAAQARALGLSGGVMHSLAQTAADVTAALLLRQGPHGQWGGVLQTAWLLTGLAAWGAPVLALQRGARQVSDRQLGDGLWGAEPFWLTFARPGTITRFGSRLITSAVAVAALAAVLSGRAAERLPFSRG